MSRFITIFLSVLVILLCACDETSTVGGSLAEDRLAIRVDSDFVIDGHSIALESVRSRTTDQLLGTIDIPEYGTLKSSVSAPRPSTRQTSRPPTSTRSYW